jgi:pyoverdine/dityrosine biosynthesis protein Dit1
VAEIHTVMPKIPTTANNTIRTKNKNRICSFFQFLLNNIKNTNINPQYNKNKDHHQKESFSS